VGWPQCMEVTIRSKKAFMDRRKQGWAIFNKFDKTSMLSKALAGF